MTPRRERKSNGIQRFCRTGKRTESWNLPNNVIEDQISAKNNDGVLIITLPKNGKEQKKEETRSITIE